MPKKRRAPAKKTGRPRLLPASKTAYAALVDAIVDGELLPGDRLSENEVARSLKLGKTPVREALRQLVLERVLTVRPRAGYAVTPVTIQDVEELCGLRLVVEPAAAALAAGRLAPDELGELDTLSRTKYSPTDRDSIHEFLKVNRRFHSIIANACGNQRLAALIEQVHLESTRIFQVQLINFPDPGEHVQLHRQLAAALRSGESEVARELCEREITASRKFLLDSFIRSPALRRMDLAAASEPAPARRAARRVRSAAR